MRRTASPVILDMKGSLPTTRMVVLPETEPATRPPKASSIDLPSTVDEIRTLREELRAEQSMIEQIHKIRRREEAYRVESEKELCAMIKRANAEKRALEQTMSRALSRDMQKEEELREKDEQLRQKDEEIARLQLHDMAESHAEEMRKKDEAHAEVVHKMAKELSEEQRLIESMTVQGSKKRRGASRTRNYSKKSLRRGKNSMQSSNKSMRRRKSSSKRSRTWHAMGRARRRARPRRTTRRRTRSCARRTSSCARRTK